MGNGTNASEVAAAESDSSQILDGFGDVSRRNFLAGATATTAAFGTIAGCIGGDNSGSTNQVEVSSLPNISSIPLYIARAEGYFEDKNIEVNLNRSISGAEETSRLATGQLDLAAGSIGASTINAVNQDTGIRLVTDRARSVRGLPQLLQFQVRSDLYEDGMNMGDVEGFTFASNAEGNVGHYVIGRALTAHGLSLSDINLEVMPFPQMVAAFESGAIDAGVLVGALGTQTRAQDLAEHIGYAAEYSPEVQVGNLMFGSSFMNDRADVAVRFLEAYVLGIRQYYELGPYSDRVLSIFEEVSGQDRAVLENSIPVWIHRNGAVQTESIMEQQDFFACADQIESKVSEDELIDQSLLEEAIDNIGAVDEPLITSDEWEQMKADSPADLPEFTEITESEVGDCGGVSI